MSLSRDLFILALAGAALGCGVAFEGSGTGGATSTTSSSATGQGGTPGGGAGGEVGTSSSGATSPGGNGGNGGSGGRVLDGAAQMVASLDGMRVEQPCLDNGVPFCTCPAYVETERTAGGERGELYQVTLRCRGVIETNTYTGGTPEGLWNIGGTPNQNTWDAFAITVSDPPETYHFNRGPRGIDYSIELDETRTLPIREGATVTLWVDADGDLTSPNVPLGGGPPIVPEGVPPAPMAFDGHFVQLYALSAQPAN